MSYAVSLCTPEDIKDFLLSEYVEACEKQNPGITTRTITAVSGEVSDLLHHRYPQPWDRVPAVIVYIVSVISAYRVVEAITSLVTTENAVENEWIPLQKEWKRATQMLDEIAAGYRKLPLDAVDEDREDASISITTTSKYFDMTSF